MSELRIRGRLASAGFAAGPLALIASAASGGRGGGAPGAEALALRSAMATALADLCDLAARSEGDGADILAFQIAMLEDAALAEPALAEIAAGAGADQGWRNALDSEIANYETADDDHFRARASDLEDIRDRVLAVLFGAAAPPDAPAGAILVGEDLTPSRFLATDWSRGGGIALTRGSASSHVATLARARAVPMIVGIGLDLDRVAARQDAIIDGDNATLCLDPAPETRQAFQARVKSAARSADAASAFAGRPAVTADGVSVSVYVNIADPAEVDRIDPGVCDGVGLVRTEFLFSGDAGLPDEETQYRAYRRLAEWAGGKPVTIRTLDAGADKPIAGLTLEHEANPFLGMRGIRLSLREPDHFKTQLRALCRAAAHGRVEVMLPMIALPSELERARGLLDDAIADLLAREIAHARPALGIMVEIPAAALAIESFDAAFFSIGSNDLTQYVMAAARDNDAVAALNDVSHLAVLRLIAQVAAHGARADRKVSLCGDAAGEPRYVEALLKAGLRALSVAPAALGRVKQAIARVSLAEAAPNG